MRYISLHITLLLTFLSTFAGGQSLGISYLETELLRSGDSLATERVVEVLDSMRMPIVALFGVESKEAICDIVTLSNQEYSYIHRTMDYYDGKDFALLYHGDRLFVERVTKNYTWIAIEGEIDNRSIIIHLTRRGDKLRTTLPPKSDTPTDITIVCGRVSKRDLKRLNMHDAMIANEKMGYGNTRIKGRWLFNSRIGCNVPSQGGVYITDWLVDRGGDLPIYIIYRDE